MDWLQLTRLVVLFLHCFHQIESYGPLADEQHDLSDMDNDYISDGCTCGEDVIDRSSQLGDDLVVVMSHEGIPCDGEVSAWEFWTSYTGFFRAFVARPVGSNSFEIIGVNNVNVTSDMFGQSASYSVPQNERINVRTGDMIGVGNFDSWYNPYIQATNRAGLYLQYATMDPSDLEASYILTTPNSFQANISVAVVISSVTGGDTTPYPIYTTSDQASTRATTPRDPTTRNRATTSRDETTRNPYPTTLNRDTTPYPIYTTSDQASTSDRATTPRHPTTINRATTSRDVTTYRNPYPTTFNGGIGCTIGEDVIDRPTQLGNNIVIVMSHEGVPCDGEVSAWEFWAGQTGSFRAFVARPVAALPSNNFEIIGVNNITVTSAMFGQSASYPVPQNDRISVQTGDMIGLGNFDSSYNPSIRASNFAGIDFQYATMDPSDLEASYILITPNAFQGTISVAAVISPVTGGDTTPYPIYTTSDQASTSDRATTPRDPTTRNRATTSRDETTRNPYPTTLNRDTTPPKPIITTSIMATLPKNPEPTTGIDTLEILECAKDSMTAYVPRSVIGNAVDASHLHFIDTSCTGTTHNATHVEMSTYFNKCGTTMEVGEDYVIFANIILDDALPVTPSGDITRDKTIEIPVQCKMAKDALASVSFDPDTSKIIYREEGYGKFSFDLQLYEDGSYMNPYSPTDYPIDVNLKDMLFFEAEVEAQQGLELFVETCVATPLNDPSSSPKYEFLQNGCPGDNTFQFFSSVDPMAERFGLEAFAFVGLHGPVYVHCYLILCNVTDPSSRCNQGCIAKSDIHKRSAEHSGSKTYRMTRGPIKLNAHDPEGQNDRYSEGVGDSDASYNSSGVMIACVGLMALCVVISGIAIGKSRQKRQDEYMIVPSFDVEAKTPAKQVQK